MRKNDDYVIKNAAFVAHRHVPRCVSAKFSIKNIIVARKKPNFIILFILAECFKVTTFNAEFYSCMGISTSLPVFLFTIETFEGVIRFNTYPSISNCSPNLYSKPLIMAIFIFPAST